VNAIHRENEALIADRFPELDRCLTGYDLAHLRDHERRFDLNAILRGASTLAWMCRYAFVDHVLPRRNTQGPVLCIVSSGVR
jgi:hypothetical protein